MTEPTKPTNERETLTDEERDHLGRGFPADSQIGRAGRKALRLLDAHAADRAALVAQVAELTRVRDEAREIAQEQRGRLIHLQAEGARLQSALAELKAMNATQSEDLHAVSVENKRLTEALAAAERDTRQALDEVDMLKRKAMQRAEAAESECAALRAEAREANAASQHWSKEAAFNRDSARDANVRYGEELACRQAAESECAALRAELGEQKKLIEWNEPCRSETAQ